MSSHTDGVSRACRASPSRRARDTNYQGSGASTPRRGNHMKFVLACALLTSVAGVASARPVVIEPSATLTNPDPVAYRQFGRMIATNGEYALVLGSLDETNGDEIMHRAALLYRRVAGSWQFQQVLHTTARSYDSYTYPSVFAMKGNLAVVELDGDTKTYRLGPAGWQPTPRTASLTEDIEVSGDRIVESNGNCSRSATVSAPEAAGTW